MIINNFWNKIEERKGLFLVVFFIVFTLSYLLLAAFDFLPEPPKNDKDKVGDEAAELKSEVPSMTYVKSVNDGEHYKNGSIKAEITELDSDNSDKIIDLNKKTKKTKETAEKNNSKVNKNKGNIIISSDAEIKSNFLPTSIYIKKLNRKVNVNNPVSGSIDILNKSLLTGVVRHPDSAKLNQKGSVLIFGHSSYLPKVINKNFQAFNGIQGLVWGDLIEVNSDNFTYVYKVDKVYETKATDANIPIAGTKNKLVLATCNTFGEKEDRFIVEASRIQIKNLDKS